MSTFSTPGPITADLHLQSGSARVIAGDRDSTVVEIRPAYAERRADVEVAERTVVDFAAGHLEVRSPRTRVGLFSNPGSIEVTVHLPAGSTVRAETAYGDLATEGAVGECSLKTAYGDLRVDDARTLHLESSHGAIRVGMLRGEAEIKSGWGQVRIDEVAATTVIGTGGDIHLGRVHADVRARTSYGRVQVEEAGGGSLDLATSYGGMELGVAAGTSTFLDATTAYGKVRNELEPVDGPADSAPAVEIRARTSYGDITISRR